MTKQEQIRTFFADVYGDEFPGWLTVWSPDRRPTGWFGSDQIETLVADVEARAVDTDVYFGVALRRENLGSKGRGRVQDVIGIPGLWMDIDVAGPTLKRRRLPESVEQASQLLNRVPLPPTLLVNSGYGLHAYWLFREPWIFDDEEERRQAADLSARFQRLVVALAATEQLEVDNTSDLARVLRVPGTVNRKGEPRPVSIAMRHPERRYNRDDFEAFLASPTVPSSYGSRAEPGPENSGTRILEGERNVTLTSWAGRLRRAGLDGPEMEAALLEVNRRRVLPPLGEEEVRSIVRSIGGRPAGNAAPAPSIFQFLDDAAMGADIEIAWQVEGLIPKGSFAEMHGPAGIGKSFLALDLAMSVATGAQWQGRGTEQGAVVYVASEQSPGGRARYHAWKEFRGTASPPPIYFVQQPVNLGDLDVVEAFLAQLPVTPSLMVFDTLARCFGDGDENSARDMGRVVRGLDTIREATGATVLVVHHSPRSRSDERGSSALRAACDVMLQVERRTSGIIAVTCAKMRDAASFEDLYFRLEEVDDSAVVVAAKQGAERPEGRMAEFLRALAQHQPCAHSEWMKHSGMEKSTFNRYRGEAVKAAYVAVEDRQYRLTELASLLLGPTVPVQSHEADGTWAGRSHRSPTPLGWDRETKPSQAALDELLEES